MRIVTSTGKLLLCMNRPLLICLHVYCDGHTQLKMFSDAFGKMSQRGISILY
jgi:hypothetical protein